MIIETKIPLLEELLEECKHVIGSEHEGYKKHLYRMVQICLALRESTEDEREKMVIAEAFHDIGVWVKNTVDYIPPSNHSARGA